MSPEALYFVRHGARKMVHGEDIELSSRGIRQAELTAAYLSTFEDINLIYASPSRRTQQTAEIISGALNLPVITDQRLIERMRLGERRDETYRQFLVEWNKTLRDRVYSPPMGDSSYESGRRVEALIDEIPEGGNAIIVSHAGTIGDFLRNVLDDQDLPLVSGSDSAVRFLDIDTCSITEVIRDGNDFHLTRFNYTDHLNP